MGNTEDNSVPAQKLDRKEKVLRAKQRRAQKRQKANAKKQKKKPPETGAPKRSRKPKEPKQRSQKAGLIPQKSQSLVLTLGAAALLIGGGGVAYWLLQLQGPGKPSGAVTFLPQETLWSYSMTTDAKQWQRLAQLGTEANRNSWAALRNGMEEALLKPQGLTYAEHVAPWVGKQVTTAYLPPSAATAESVAQTATIWVLPMRDQRKAQSLFVGRLVGESPQKRTHQGVSIQEFQTQDQQNVAIATLDNRYLVITLAGIPIEQVIETFKGKPSVAELPRYAEAMAAVHANRPLAKFYVNLPLATAQMAANTDQQTLSPAAIAQMKEVSGLGATVTLDQQTLTIQAISWLDPKAKQTLTPANGNSALAQRLPANTLVAFTGNSFKALWDAYSNGTPAQLVVPFNPQRWAKDFSKTTDIDFAKTFVPWMDREFAGAILPVTEADNTGIGIAFLARSSDRTAANQAFKQLDDAMREKFDLQITGTNVNDIAVINWRVPPGLSIATRGWLEERLSFMTLGAPISEAIVNQSAPTLAQSAAFRQATQTSLKPEGQFYVSIAPTLQEMKTNPLFPKLAPDALKFAEGLETIGATSAIHEDWAMRFDAQITLKKPQP